MTRSDIPFNIYLLQLTPDLLRGMRPVTALDIFDGTGHSLHPDGLFSVTIFGKVGDERRNLQFSYIDIKVPVFHPAIYRAFVALKRLYGGIMAGTEYALWNDQLCDFERSDAIAGKTGFAYFVEHWKKIKFEETKSTMREQNILLIQQSYETALTDKIVVLPAGLRDVEIGADGRTREDELNTPYRQILSVSNTITDGAVRTNPELINVARHSLQMKFNTLYEMIEAMLEGKKKLIMAKWASRRIFHGTRNVITAMDTSAAYLGSPGSVSFNNTVMGLYQALKSITPVALHHLRRGFLSKVFISVDSPVTLVDKKTRKSINKQLPTKYFDRYMTDEGLEKVLTSFGQESLRHLPLEIEGCYLGLIYKGPDGTFKIIQDIDEVPGTRSKLDVHPLTFCELLYVSCYKVVNTHPVFVTRYPVTGVGSIYPSMMFVKTTIRAETRRELSDTWEPMEDSHVASEFPITGGAFVNSLVPHSAKLKRLGAD